MKQHGILKSWGLSLYSPPITATAATSPCGHNLEPAALVEAETLWDPESKERELVDLVEKIKHSSDQAVV